MLPIHHKSLKQLLDKQLYNIADYPNAILIEKRSLPKDTIILVNSLSAEDKTFLLQILKAIGLALEDVALLNMKEQPITKISHLKRIYQPKQIIIFGISCPEVSLNFRWPPYHILDFLSLQLLFSESLEIIKNDKLKKRKLWACLKKIFA